MTAIEQKVVSEVEAELLKLVEDFIAEAGIATHIELINELQYHWLTSPPVDLSRDANQDRLHMSRLLVNFLSHLHECNAQISFLKKEADS